MSKIKVLLIDDDTELTAMLAEYIQQEGFDVHAVNESEAGATEAIEGDYSIVVLDIMMPRMSGIEVLRRIRAQSNIPVVILTARGDNLDRIVGLDLGADDYVPKPSTPGELVARIRAILRRTDNPSNPSNITPISVGELTLWPGTREVTLAGNSLSLTGTEFSLLSVLAINAGHLVSKDEMSRRALGRPLSPFDRRIDVHVSSIRQKLGAREDGQSWIQTVRGMGYQLINR